MGVDGEAAGVGDDESGEFDVAPVADHRSGCIEDSVGIDVDGAVADDDVDVVAVVCDGSSALSSSCCFEDSGVWSDFFDDLIDGFAMCLCIIDDEDRDLGHEVLRVEWTILTLDNSMKIGFCQ